MSESNHRVFSNELLAIEHLTLRRERLRKRWFHHALDQEDLVDDVSFSIERRRSFSLVGEENSGKLAITMALLKLHPVASGRIVFGDVDLTALPEQRFRPIRRRIQAVFPDRFGQLTPDLTISQAFREVLSVWHRHSGKDDWHQRIDAVMISCGLPEAVRDLYPVELDAVERQQVALARALLTGPELLICHGLTEGFDTVQRAEMMNLVRALKENFRLSLLVMTDDLAVGHHLSDDIGILHQGRLLEIGLADQVVSRPEHDYTRRLVSCSL